MTSAWCVVAVGSLAQRCAHRCVAVQRREEQGEARLVSQRRRPKTRPQRNVFAQAEAWILELRRERNFGARRIQQEWRRQHQYHLSLEAIDTSHRPQTA